MDYYLKELEKKQELLHETFHDYPLFSEMLDDIEKHELRDINELLDKNDEYYLKEAIKKIEYLIDDIKKTSETIDLEYETFDKNARIWEKLPLPPISKKELDVLNNNIDKANKLIKSHDLEDLKEANKIMEKLIRQIRG